MIYGMRNENRNQFTEVERRKFVAAMLHIEMELADLVELTNKGDLQCEIREVIDTLISINDRYANCKNRLASTVYDLKLIHMYKPELTNAELAAEVGLEESAVRRYIEK